MLDVASGKELRQDMVGPQPWRVAMTSDERVMVTANTGDQTLSLIAMAHGDELARLKGAETMEAILPAWFDTTGFVLSRSEKALLVIDLDKARMAPPVALPGIPEAAVASPGGGDVIVAMSQPGEIAVIDARERRVTRLIGGVLADPFRIATVGSRNICD
jgi:DNA-binding beta-propeller fold protein YncE